MPGQRADTLRKSLPKDLASASDPDVLSAFATDESGRRGKPPLFTVAARSTSDIESLVKWAVASRVALLPVSSGHGPRRRGDTVSDHECVIVDLSAMDRIRHVDGRDAVAIIEPGVTFPALNTALHPHGLRTFQPLAPGGAKSVLAAFLEREPMTVPGKHWDNADPLASMEVVFGTGDVFRTGGASQPGTLEDNLARGNRQLLAAGPSFTDFGRVIQGAQGALGIVAWASILCQRIPAMEVPLFASGDDLGRIVDLAYRMLRRRPAGQMFILNHVQLALLLADDAAAYAALKTALPRWILYVELAASRYFPEEAIGYQRADLERDAAGLRVPVTAQVANVDAAMVGQRQRRFSNTPAHRRAGLACQEVFAISQLDWAPAQHAAMTPIAQQHGDLGVYLQPVVHGVSAHCQYTFLDTPARTAELARSAIAAAETLADNKGFLSRPYHPWAHVPFARDRTILPLLQKTKGMFDPSNILNPDAMSLGGLQ